MLLLAVVLLSAVAMHIGGMSEIAGALVLLYASFALWRHHRSASVSESEAKRQEEEDRVAEREQRRMVQMLSEARERRREESGPAKRRSTRRMRAVDPTGAAEALRKMIREQEAKKERTEP